MPVASRKRIGELVACGSRKCMIVLNSSVQRNLFAFVATAVIAIGLCFATATGAARAQFPPEGKKTQGPRPASTAAMPAFTPEREAAAMKFVREHHAEVADLLDSLRTSRPAQYRQAARELFRSSERVSQWKERDAARYELELKAWKINSRIQLLLARSTMSPDVDVETELKSLLTERVETRLALRKLDREQLAKRLAAAEADIARLSGDKDAAVDRQLSQMTQKIKANRQRAKSRGGKNAKNSASSKTAREAENATNDK
jgi:hypothetical protein